MACAQVGVGVGGNVLYSIEYGIEYKVPEYGIVHGTNVHCSFSNVHWWHSHLHVCLAYVVALCVCACTHM